MLFDARITQTDPWVVVRIIGELDLAAVPSTRSVLQGAASSLPGSGGLVLDLRQVDFCDSAGLGVLLGGVRRARNVGLPCVAVCGDGRLRDLLALTGLDLVMDVVDAPPEGVEDAGG